ncbi:HEXXH motif domain-containing protein [Dactylosporangium sp. NPDC051541]|uniref:HEXXH motif domain-containing protein n=1 Tax=Dactylosporangium sp. NPDC051541 TaxID=3363977 RepID=UPI0037979FF8
MSTYYRLPPELLDGLAASTGGPAASLALAEVQLSKHVQLINQLLGAWPGSAAERDRIVAALDAARAAAPEAAGRVLGRPMVGAWAAIAGRAAFQGRADSVDLAHLGAIAAVTCAAAGVDAELEAPVRDGAVALPGTARVETGADGPDGTARVTVSGGAVAVDAGRGAVTADSAGWQPVRALRAEAGGRRAELALDDVDPYRHGYHAPPAPRLSEADFEQWQERFTGAWQLLAEHLPDRAAEIAAGLRVLVPLHDDGRSSRSATIRHVFGVFGLTRPATAADFAVTLVHEYQHSKLSALLDTVQLSDPDDEGRYFAPWRTDPRPLAGLIQGVYAFAGVADTWRALRGAGLDAAEQEFANARLQVDRSLISVEESGGLTAEGERFIAHLRRFTDELLAEPVPAAVAARAEERQQELRRRWLAANGVAA